MSLTDQPSSPAATGSVALSDSEAQAIAHGDFIADLTQFALLSFSGPDARTFLQGQLSCDVDPLATQFLSTFGAYCSAKGRMLASFLLWRQGEDWHMMLPGSIAEAVKKRLSMFILRAKVKLESRSDFALVGIGGPGAAGALHGLITNIPKIPHELVAAEDLTAIALPGQRWLLCGQRKRVAEASIRMAGVLSRIGTAAWDWTDIREGIPWVTARTQDHFVPQMAAMERIGGVSFKKGCYPGQEIVARSQYLGQLKRRLYRAHVDTTAEAGDEVHSEDMAGQSNGMVVNAAPAPGGGSDILVVVQTDSAENSGVHLRSPSGPLLRFLPLPYPQS